MTKKIRVAILFGGKSAEHEVSLRSAKNVVEAMDKKKYEPVLIGINKTGRWLPAAKSGLLLSGSGSGRGFVLGSTSANRGTDAHDDTVALVPQENGKILGTSTTEKYAYVDVVFPVLHGPFGEDGTVQGLLKLANVPFVGAGVLGSAVGMDKDVMKRLLANAGIPIGKFLVFKKHETGKISFNKTKKSLGLPFFVKPSNLGSSVGISKVHDKKEFAVAIKEAFKYDNKILIEEFIKGREIECSVLGNDVPVASVPGEVISQHEFYSYDAKYLDENGALLEIPADLPKSVVKNIQKIAVKTFKVLCCEGMARVDFFLTSKNKVIVNEINTIPGFTSISMYPKLWEKSGISYGKLIDKLISLAIERFESEAKLQTSVME